MSKPYRTYIFDCDGVLLNSNKVKTEAFYAATLQYGDTQAQAMVDYHRRHGGVSRYRKFEHFFSDILRRDAGHGEMEAVLDHYATEVRKSLLTCEVTPGLEALRAITRDCSWMIISGGDQTELREVFSARELSQYFDAGIFGSPSTKDEIVAQQVLSRQQRLPAIFFGDSRYDYLAARQAGLDFAFIFGWTEFDEWKDYFASDPDVTASRYLADAFKKLSSL